MRALIAGLAALTALGPATGSAGAATRAPVCVPRTLNNSARLDDAITVSPLPGSLDATPQTQISLLGVAPSQISAISVSGSRTGSHQGRLAAYSEGDGESFLPAEPFVEGETVTVRGRVRLDGREQPLIDQFAIAHRDQISSTPEPIQAGTADEIEGFRSRPDLHPPVLTVTARSPSLAPGDEFVAPYDGPGQSGPMILDPEGGLVWFKPLPRGTSATNLRVQQYQSQPVLTWWQGDISIHGFGLGEDVIDDGSYREIAHVQAGNGLRADLHDFQLTPAGTALITAYDPIRCDLSSVSGPSDGAVTDGVTQEIDVRTGLVMYQWDSLDHVGLGESYELARYSRPDRPFDFFHINSIDPLADGSLLVSGRNTWSVYDLDAESGQIRWRLGGRQSSFAMEPGTRTAWQHDPRELPDGTISILDNGASPKIHSQSRAIVVRLNEQQHSASLVAQITRPAPILADSQGNAQQLPNGDWFIGWGQVPDFSELSASGALLFDAHFPPGDQSYRDLRYEWAGTPSEPPAFALERGAGGASTLYASWNGSTLLASWRVLAGASPARLRSVAQAPRAGFETAISLPATAQGPYVTVQALAADGPVLAAGRVEDALR